MVYRLCFFIAHNISTSLLNYYSRETKLLTCNKNNYYLDKTDKTFQSKNFSSHRVRLTFYTFFHLKHDKLYLTPRMMYLEEY